MKVKLFIIVTMAFLLFIPAGFLSAQYDPYDIDGFKPWWYVLYW